MEQNHGRNSLLEKELKKGVVKSTAPIGLIITALGLGIVMIIGSYLIKYIRGPLPLNEVYNTEQVKNEYVTLHVQYVLDSFMETYKTRSGNRTKSDTYYLILDEELGAIPVRSSVTRSEELERIMDETWDYLNGVREAPPQGSTITGTMKRMKDEGEKYYQRALDYYELEGSGENYYLWDGLLDNQTPGSAMMTTALGAVLMCLGLFILSRLLKKGHIESIQSFLDSHPEVTRDYLEADFQSAEKLAGRFWVGRYFTYGAYDKPEILSNEEITRAWYQVRSVGRSSVQELVCLTRDGREHSFSMNQKTANQVISQYQAINPELAKKMGLRDKAVMNGGLEENS